jgi:hypothetical protein
VSETQVYQNECVLIALAGSILLLVFLMRYLRRAHPGLLIGNAVAAAFGLRVIAALGLDQTPIARELRGGDELLFLSQAQGISNWDLVSTANVDALTKHFHYFFFSLNYRVFDLVPQMMLRVEVIAFSVAGLALMAAAVHELAGPRPARIAAWILALEPASIFFSGILHKEPFMFLAEGLFAYGGAKLWKRGDFRALVPMVLGCLIATATRPYVGWFLAAATAVVMLHAGLRRNSASTSFALVTVVVVLMGAFFPVVWNASSKQKLSSLQQSQDANAGDSDANLALERVDYSSRDKVILNLPKRVLDVVTKPYPWQLQNTSQQLGLFGTMFLFVGLILLFAQLIRNGKVVMKRAGPLVYPALFLLVAYSLSAGNAGTAFRYRTHIVAFLVAVLVVLREERRTRELEAPAPLPARLRPALVHGRSS